MRSLFTVGIAALAVSGAALCFSGTPEARAAVTVFSPLNYSTVKTDEEVRFSWYAANSEDSFRVVFSQFQSFGWDTSTKSTAKTVLSSQYATPASIGLSPGTWYWRVCASWYTNPGVCYLSNEIRTLTVEQAKRYVYSYEANNAARIAISRRFGRVTSLRTSCTRYGDNLLYCKSSFKQRRKSRSQRLRITGDQDGIYYSYI
jgi:hypothetical protein